MSNPDPYLMQYSISNLNAFIILVSIGFSFYIYITNNPEEQELMDKNNSPVQLIRQLRGLFWMNSWLAISLAITLFSFAGIPPLMGFFAKMLVLSSALDTGYIFMALVAIFTSVIGGVYYLNIIKEMFFYTPDLLLNLNPQLRRDLAGLWWGKKAEDSSHSLLAGGEQIASERTEVENAYSSEDSSPAAAGQNWGKSRELSRAIMMANNSSSIQTHHPSRFASHLAEKDYNIVMTSPISISISTLTLLILFFIFLNPEWLSMIAILANILFNT